MEYYKTMAGCGGGGGLLSQLVSIWFEMPFFDKQQINAQWKASVHHAWKKGRGVICLKA